MSDKERGKNTEEEIWRDWKQRPSLTKQRKEMFWCHICCDSYCEQTQNDHTLRHGSCYARTLSPLWRWGRSVVSVSWHSTPDDSVRVHDWWFSCVWQTEVYLFPLPASIFSSHSRTVTSPFGPNQPGFFTVPVVDGSSSSLSFELLNRGRWWKWSKNTENPKFSGPGFPSRSKVISGASQQHLS